MTIEKQIKQVLSYRQATQTNTITLSKEDRDRLNDNYTIVINTAKKICPNFEIDNNNKEFFKKLIIWATGENMEGIDPNKGICVYGGKGTGKTMAMRIMQRVLSITENKFIIFNTMDIVGDLSGNKKRVIDYCEPYQYNKNQCFDDLGFERNQINTFGNIINPMAEIIAKRSELYVKYGIQTHFTTNLIDTEIEAIYGDRVFDRMVEMCNFIKLTGESRRK